MKVLQSLSVAISFKVVRARTLINCFSWNRRYFQFFTLNLHFHETLMIIFPNLNSYYKKFRRILFVKIHYPVIKIETFIINLKVRVIYKRFFL